MKRSDHLDVRVHLCGEHLLVLGDQLGQDRLLPVASALWLANALRQPGAEAFVHRRGTEPAPDAAANVQLLGSADEARADGWVILRRGHVEPIVCNGRVQDSRDAPFTLSGHQPAYLAYLGYFAKIAAADLFSIAADMRFGRQTFQHRQRLVDDEKQGTWLTIPVVNGRGSGGEPIAAKRIAGDGAWAAEHLARLRARYKRLPYYELYERALSQFYSSPWSMLVDITDALTRLTAHWLGLETTAIVTVDDTRYRGLRRGGRIARELSDLMLDAGRDNCRYLAGEAGATYLFERAPGRDWREIDDIHATGTSVAVCSYDQGRLTDLGLAAGEPALGLLCAAGPASHAALAEGIVIRSVQVDRP